MCIICDYEYAYWYRQGGENILVRPMYHALYSHLDEPNRWVLQINVDEMHDMPVPTKDISHL